MDKQNSNIGRNLQDGEILNVIRYTENKDGKSFEATFSNEAAGNIAVFFAQFFKMGFPPAQQVDVPSPAAAGSEISRSEQRTAEAGESDLERLDRIFKRKDDAILLSMKNLKAKNTTENQVRVCLLYLYYCQLNNLGDVSRRGLYDFMRGVKAYSDSFRSWVSRNSSLFTRHGVFVELSFEGQEKAKSILNVVFDDSVSTAPFVQAGTRKTNPGSKKPGSQPVFLSELDLSPSNSESLDSFMKRHNYRESAAQLNLLFVYYLKQIRKIETVDKDHVFTCYRTLGLKLPKDLYHSIADVISKNRWLMNISDLTLTSEGLNMVEQKMRLK